MTEIAVFESQPNATSRIGCDASHQGDAVASKFFLNAQVAYSEQLAFQRADIDAHPYGVVAIRCDGRDHAERAPIKSVDGTESTTIVNAQSVVVADPETSDVVLP